jgi:hypothetical protein
MSGCSSGGITSACSAWRSHFRGRHLEIFRITRAAYRNGGLYVRTTTNHPGDVAGVASYWEGQLRQYEEHLADGGPVM